MSINKKEFNLEQVVKLCVVVNISLFLFVAFMLILFVYFNICSVKFLFIVLFFFVLFASSVARFVL